MTNLKKTVDEMEKIIDVVGILNGEIVQIDYYLVFSSNQDNHARPCQRIHQYLMPQYLPIVRPHNLLISFWVLLKEYKK